LATAWEIASDLSSITFKLRKGVKFHDGSDFNADAAAWNLQKKLDNHDRGTDGWSSIEKPDAYTVRINLKEYNNYLLSSFTGIGSAMISKAAYEQKGEEYSRWHPIGTGPFVFESYQRDVVTKFRKNENYWRKGLPYLDGVELHYIKDPMTQQAALKRGEIDILTADTGKMVADLQQQGYNVLTAQTGEVVMVPDSKNADSPFSKQQVREAVSCAIDRDAIIKARGFGFWEPAYQLSYKDSVGHISGLQHRYDPEKAKQLLKEAGYPKGFKTKITPMGNGTDKDVIVAVQAYLSAVGIDARVENVPMSKYSEYRFKGWDNGLMMQPFGVSVNPNQTYDGYFNTSVKLIQFPVMKRPDGFQTLLDKSIITREPQKEMLDKLAQMIYDDVSVIPIYVTGRAVILQKNVHDTGHLEWARWLQWRPDKAWKSK
jgi:peptide/nickel transport system substrate-binding protein